MFTDDDLRRELTAAFHEQADPIARTAIQPPALPRRAIWRRHKPAATKTGSMVAAAAAVAAVVSLVTVAGRPAVRPPGAARHTGVPPSAPVVKAPSASDAARGMPAFYVFADHDRPVAAVRDSATGRLLGTVPLPAWADPKVTRVTVAGDDRTFVLALLSDSSGTRFYKLRITSTGQPAGLTRLAIPPLPAQEGADSIAVTADGTRLAVATQVAGGQGRITVITLATGAARTWTTPRGGTPEDLSWDSAGRRLGYFWASDSASTYGLWLLDTSAPGTRLLTGRRLLPEVVGPDLVQDAWLTPDARAIIASVTYDKRYTRFGRGTVVGGIVELSARTGRPLWTLLAEHAAYSRDAGWYMTSCLLASIDRTGTHLLVSCDKFGRLDRGRFTALPGAAPQMAVAATW